ncbi:hypothetical protein I553_5093 [Mycobacterium xenopi 4042]|uniref:Uncharacterized protein n=1 Tax=Mycobacterium xenopi 4042 TaxID=1299334 RepID=X7ZW55_MYCXE|nr:hypothetical protein I553_5093 [Mycobacterium xenopi 4042]
MDAWPRTGWLGADGGRHGGALVLTSLTRLSTYAPLGYEHEMGLPWPARNARHKLKTLVPAHSVRANSAITTPM